MKITESKIARKFVEWSVPPLNELSESLPYVAKAQALEGNLKPLKALYDMHSYNMATEGYVKLYGWLFDFRMFFKTFLVRFRYDSNFHKVYGLNKTAMYKALGGRYQIVECYEITNK